MSPGTKKEKSPRVLAHSVASPCLFSSAVVNADYTTGNPICQDNALEMCNSDYTESAEIEKKFTPKRKCSELLASSYERIGFESKASRVSDCGTFLEFAHEISSDGIISEKGKLHNANFCKDRLCPLCSWRRSYKIFAQVSQIMELIGSEYDFLFLTLTVPSVPSELLSETLSRMIKAWDCLCHRKAFKSSVNGFFRALEITRNNDRHSKSFGLYHPHFHCVLAVSRSYFKDKYISRDEWLSLWQSCYKDESITQVDIRRARDKFADEAETAVNQLSSAVAEIAKYAVKSSDYIFADNEALTDDIVRTLAEALRGRRLTAFGGCFKEAFEKLKLDDAEDGDLVHINDELNPALAWLIVRYGWSAGAYKMTDSFVRQPESEVKTD